MPVAAATPLYADWTFWSTIIALAAFVVSVLPYVIRFLRPARLDVDLHQTLSINHKVGNPGINAHIRLQNVGGSDAKVTGMTLKIIRDGVHLVTINAKTFMPNNGTNTQGIIFTPFLLKAGDEWAQIVGFWSQPSREDERTLRGAESALRNNIAEQQMPANALQNRLPIRADRALVDPLMALFNRRFIWVPGVYEIELEVQTVPAGVARKQSFRFTLFESDSDSLRDVTQDYATGAGIYFNNIARPEYVFIEISKA
ncbi:hypothetical protein LGN30_05770 [Burkholderia seminalis]|uniref:hypothetical protein n=1 Tax=Burkholderia seminalis TaxID=488731 RepID=UPI001CF2BBCB|nr:hypothetical protein [Burkholderia seminalis]MCA8422690.1 hypothetical protein [Burkholderia seminalis]